MGFVIPVVPRLTISRSCWRQCMQVLRAVGDDRPVMTGEGGLSTTVSCDGNENSGNERKTVKEHNKNESINVLLTSTINELISIHDHQF